MSTNESHTALIFTLGFDHLVIGIIAIAAAVFLGMVFFIRAQKRRYRHSRLNQQAILDEDIRLQAKIMEQMAEAILLVRTSDGAIIYCTSGVERMFGYSAGDLFEKHFTVLLDPVNNAPEEVAAAISDSVLKKGIWEGETRNKTKNSLSFWCAVSVSVFTHPQYGDVWMISNRNITERKELENQLKQSFTYARSLIESSLDPLVTISAEGKITDVNEGSVKITGVRREELIGTDFSDYFTEPEKAREGYQQVFARGSVTDYPLTIRHRNGNLTDVLYNASVYKDVLGNVLGVFAAAREVTESKRIMSELIETKNFLDNILQSSIKYSIIGKDLKYFIVSWNEGAKRNYGYLAEEILGENSNILHAPEDIASGAVEKLMATAYEKGLAEGEFERIRKDGSHFMASVVVTRRNDVSGNPIGYLLMSSDISEKKRADEQLRHASQYARSLIEASLDPLVTISAEGKITDVNEGSVKVTGAPREELIGTDFSDYFTEPEKAREGYQQVFAKGFVIDYPLTIRHRNGTLTDVLYNASVYKDSTGNVLGVFAAARDVTMQKQAEEELRSYKDHLEEVVQQRTTDLVLARNAAEAANQAKSVFLANMSHELRTPLNAILGFSNMMRKDPLQQESNRQNLDIINRSGEHLLTLINDVLEMAKIEAGRVQLENASFDLGVVVRDVTDMMQLRAQDKGLQLLIDQDSQFPRYIAGDEARLRQVLINLIGNAVKYTQTGGVTLRLGTKQNRFSHLLIEVEDSGPGITPEDQQRIFEPFVQLDEQGDSKGTGLGLTITRQFVQMMGGRISLESTPGKGSLFRVDLPLTEATEADIAKPKPLEKGEPVGLAPGQPEYRILIVEDQRDNQLLLTKLMESVGFQFKVAENGKQGIELFQSWQPHLIWMDRRMPVMDGLEATRHIRELPGGKVVKIIAVTASAFAEQRTEMLEAGMDDFVRKPYRSNEIYECLTKQLGVSYIYEDAPEPEQSAIELTPEMLSILPEGLRIELANALVSLETESIELIIQQVATYDRQLERTLTFLAEKFDYPTILKALGQPEDNLTHI